MSDPQSSAVAVALPHPALQAHHDVRQLSLENRIADAITSFAGSMRFLYVHIGWFAIWIAINVSPWRLDAFPFGLLTMIVSLEAIFLSTFVMISQNRADAKRQVLADDQWRLVQLEDAENRQLLELTKKILDLTKAVHSATAGKARD